MSRLISTGAVEDAVVPRAGMCLLVGLPPVGPGPLGRLAYRVIPVAPEVVDFSDRRSAITQLLAGEMPYRGLSMGYTQGHMTDRTAYYNEVNRRTPVVPFRAPSRGHLEQVDAAAEAAGMSRSEWIRLAVARALADLTTPST